MEQLNGQEELLAQFRQNPPKIIGGYKKQGWAVKVLEKIGNETVEFEDDGSITAKAVLESSDKSFYPAFVQIDVKQRGQIVGVYFISEKKEQFDLIPFEIAKEFIEKEKNELVPFKYKTLEKINGDEFQKNWPGFS